MTKEAKKKNKKENSRLHFYDEKMLLKCKRSQISIFVILAIAIVAVLIIIFYPRIKLAVQGSPTELTLQNCLDDDLRTTLASILEQGGSLEPSPYVNYEGEKIEYLCYTNAYYEPCVMQNPLLKQSVEEELSNFISSKVKACIEVTEEKLKSQGYIVTSSGSGNIEVKIIPDSIVINLDKEIQAKKEDSSTEMTIKTAIFGSQAYDIIMISSSIANWETNYGDSNPETYMTFYPNIKVEKKRQSDGTKVYIITDRNTGEVLRFATRSFAVPAGYAY